MKIRAVGYRRVSTSQQKIEGFSLPQQKLEIEAYAAAAGMELVADFWDDLSGANMNRPGLEQALEALRNGQAQALIICESDRLSRSAPDYMWLRETLRTLGIQLHNARRGEIQLNDFGSQIVEDVWGRVAEMERQRIVNRMILGKLSKARQGHVVYPNILPYGYASQNEVVYIVEYEADVVRWIFEAYAERSESLKAIARQLTESGAPTYYDTRPAPWLTRPIARGRWSPATVACILKNETYVGRWHYNKTGGGRANAKDEWVEVGVPAIITESEFNAAQLRLIDNKRLAKRNLRHEYLVRGRITCACGKNMFSITSKQTNGKMYRYYQCRSCGRGGNINAGVIDDTMWAWIKRMLTEPKYLSGLANAYLEGESSRQAELTDQLAGVRQRLDANLQRQRRLAQTFVIGDIDDVALTEIGAGLKEEKAGLLRQEALIVKSLEQAVRGRDYAAELMRVMSTFEHGLRFYNEPFYIRAGWVEALQATVAIQPGGKFGKFSCVFDTKVLPIDSMALRGIGLNWQIELTAILPLQVRHANV